MRTPVQSGLAMFAGFHSRTGGSAGPLQRQHGLALVRMCVADLS